VDLGSGKLPSPLAGWPVLLLWCVSSVSLLFGCVVAADHCVVGGICFFLVVGL
jgi:hypothetical protein